VRVLASVDHPNIIKFYEAFVDTNDLSLWQEIFALTLTCSLILEYADGGNLQEYVEFLKLNNMLISEREALMIVIQIVKGLRALHKKKIIHRDLKVSDFL
jgi:serine/threonine protein kinase